MSEERTSARKLAKYLCVEHPDCFYLKQVCRSLRKELEIEIPRNPNYLLEIPTEEETQRFYETVWKARKLANMILIKTLFYIGVLISELVWAMWIWTVAKYTLPVEKEIKIASSHSPLLFEICSVCIYSTCRGAVPSTYLNLFVSTSTVSEEG
jgi:hypothetical protein